MDDHGGDDRDEAPIGELFGRLIDDGKAYAHAEIDLVRARAEGQVDRAKLPLSQVMAQLMAGTVLLELIRPLCRTCSGAGVSVIDELKVTCPACGGITVHRYTDKERARLCRVSPSDCHKYQSRYEIVMGVALQHDCAEKRAHERMG